jgi:YidC/Oxa1 family membrane protein insertase
MNDTESPSMDRNLWTAIALSIAVYAVWFGFFEKKVNPPLPKTPATASAPSVPGAPAPTSAAQNAGAAYTSSGSREDAKDLLAKSDLIQLGDADARVSPRGAALASYSFQGPVSRVELVSDPNDGLFAAFSDLTFSRDPSAKTGIVYAATRPDGVKITKEFVPGQGTVLPRLVIIASNPAHKPVELPAWTLTVGPGLGTVESELKDNPKLTRAIGLTPETPGLKGRIDVLKPGPHPGPYRWIGVDNRYFLAAILPSAEQFEPASAAAPATLILTAKPVKLAPGGTFTWELPYYLGPKGHTGLERYGIGLERAIDFGFFSQIGRWMLDAMVWLHGLIGNWGWAIIALTLCLQTLLLPLTYKSLKAAASMRKVQPQIAKLQAKYKDDPTRLNTEMMALYKTAGANPLGGCLPMLLQMPVFIALYNALRSSWELHGAVWMFWIHDLSAKDPYYVLPVVMGGLMWAQSRLNPPAGDPAQQQMMQFMPLIFTFMFLKFPAGLVLYWLTNSLVSTVLQLALRDHFNSEA